MNDESTPPLMISVDAGLRDLIPGFLNNRRHDIEQLRGAMAIEDFGTIRTLGHRMRGDGGGYGFDMISEIGQALEQAAQDKNATEIARKITALIDYLDRIEVVYE